MNDYLYLMNPNPTNTKTTGHQHLKEFGIINMPRFQSGGRLYDPIVGRMLNVDNFVQDEPKAKSRFIGNPFSSQVEAKPKSRLFIGTFNRYSYVINNPLKYTDPSGWKLIGKFKERREIRRIQALFNAKGKTVQGSTDETSSSEEDEGGFISSGGGGGSWVPNVFGQPNHDIPTGGTDVSFNPNMQYNSNSKPSPPAWHPPFYSNAVSFSTGGSEGSGGSKQTFLKPTEDYIIDGIRFQSMSKRIGEILGFKSGLNGERGAFIHLFSYTAYILGGMNLSKAKKFADMHERGEVGPDAERDKSNNVLVFRGYYQALNGLNKTFTNKYDYAKEIVLLMSSIGFYRYNFEGELILDKLSDGKLKKILNKIEELLK
jgi:hypothetical protein